MNNLKAIIFDLDGVLANTEPLHFAAYQAAFDFHGIEFSELDHRSFWVDGGEGLSGFIDERALPREMEKAIYEFKTKNFLNLLNLMDVAIFENISLVERLFGKVKLAVATNSSRESLEAILRKIKIGSLFQETVSRDDVERPKPSPDSFLTASRRLNVEPHECLVIEDAQKGIIAAQQASMVMLYFDMPKGTLLDINSGTTIDCNAADFYSIQKLYRNLMA